jgi:hypothetical protein
VYPPLADEILNRISTGRNFSHESEALFST